MTFEELSPPYSTIVADPPWHYDGFPPSFCRRPRLGWDSWGYGYEEQTA